MRRSVDPNREILGQVQEVVIPITTERWRTNGSVSTRMIGAVSGPACLADLRSLDLFDNMYELVDILMFKLSPISPNMWPVFELTYHSSSRTPLAF